MTEPDRRGGGPLAGLRVIESSLLGPGAALGPLRARLKVIPVI